MVPKAETQGQPDGQLPSEPDFDNMETPINEKTETGGAEGDGPAEDTPANGQPKEQEKHEQKQEGAHDQKKDGEDKPQEKKPAGGYDSTPVPKMAPGFTLKITIHRATNLPMADFGTWSSDPYVMMQMNADVPLRHKEDPLLRMRTPTIQRNTHPEWNCEWVIANVPASGFNLKCRVYDEDPADHDDRLGNAHIDVPSLNENWEGIKEQAYKIHKRSGSKRAYLIRAVAACFGEVKKMYGELIVSIEMLGRTQHDKGGRMYTLGPCWYTQHYSPMLGRLVNRKEPDEDGKPQQNGNQGKKTERYNFEANQIQLRGPVPDKLYHRYVEFKPFVKGMFTGHGIRGFLLSKALHHQHNRVYNFNASTKWGHFPQGPCKEMTMQFLNLVHHDKGGRIFTYVLTLDNLWRFTETGKEFGIDMLSKHTMHSDVSIYIAFSGEFFIRRLKHSHRPPPPEPTEETSQSHPPDHGQNPTHPAEDISSGPPDDEPPKDPSYYELVIDNDSGTYRPNAELLPVLKDFLAQALPGLHIMTLDCAKDSEKMDKMKQEQREKKKTEGDNIVFMQGSRSGSISSSDEEDLDALAAGNGTEERGFVQQIGRQAKGHQQAKWDKAKRTYKRSGKSGAEDAQAGEASADADTSVGAQEGEAAREAA